jgi:F420-dependent methylenetetrahydromethanopterin dehydrogenase
MSEVPVIPCKATVTRNPDGTQSVTVHVPTLEAAQVIAIAQRMADAGNEKARELLSQLNEPIVAAAQPLGGP